MRIQAASATLLFLALFGSLAWQGLRSIRGESQDRAFESDSGTFVSILADRLDELRTRVRTPREWKRLLNHLRLATTSIVPLLCDADPEYREALERLARLQRDREQQGPGLRQRLAQAREDQARASLPHRSFDPELEVAAMRDIVDVLLAQWTNRPAAAHIPEQRVKLIRDNLPDLV